MRRDVIDADRGPAAPAAAAPVAGGLRLRRNDVDLWRVSLDEAADDCVAELRNSLSADEEERASRLYFERDRRRFIVGRGLLRALLARYLGCTADEIGFQYGPNGKPELAPAFCRRLLVAAQADTGGHPSWSRRPAAALPLHFNLAHSENVAVFAFCRTGEVGVDVERIRDLPDWESIASTCFTRAERARIEHAEPARRSIEFFHAWTRQEALLKATGAGLGGAVEIGGESVRESVEPNAVHAYPTAALPRGRFVLRRLHAGPGFAAAIALPRGVTWATCFSLDCTHGLGRLPKVRRSPRVRMDLNDQAGLKFL
jgi:4'-phosphopantetheinyl transferase